MTQYLTLEDLSRFDVALGAEERRSLLTRAAERSPVGSTFLSHSSKDVAFLPALVKLLESHGARVYLDKIDETLPPFTSRETARALRARIADCRKFVLFASKTSKESTWIPWELGLADGLKSPSSTAVFPAVDSATDTAWTEREYLGIYDRVVWGELHGHPKAVWMVLNQEKNTATELSEWLRAGS